MPASASAFCWVSAAAMVTGVMAPIKVKGVTATAWPCSDMAMSPSLIAWSKRRGEFTEMMVVTEGSSRISSRVLPREIATMSIPSSARSRPMAVQ
jgi:hypothetical protein